MSLGRTRRTPATVWVESWFASSAATFLELIRAELPQTRLIYTHRDPDQRAAAAADLCSTSVPLTADDVVSFATTHDIDVVVPARNIGLVARTASRLAAAGVTVALPTADLGTLESMLDKQRTYQMCEDHQLALTPRWRVASGARELLDVVGEWTARNEACCIKPTIGEGAAGFRVVDPGWNPSDALLEWPSVVVSPAELERLVAGLGRDLPPMLVSDFLPGDETSVDVASHDGEVIACVTRRKLSASTQVIERDPETEAVVNSISKHWALHGCWNAQFRDDTAGQPRLLELNPRPAAGSLYTAPLGVNFPALAVLLASGADITPVRQPDSYLICRRQVADLVRRGASG